MLSKLLTPAFQPAIQQINSASVKGLPHLVTGLDASARSVMIAQLYHQRPQQLLSTSIDFCLNRNVSLQNQPIWLGRSLPCFF